MKRGSENGNRTVHCHRSLSYLDFSQNIFKSIGCLIHVALIGAVILAVFWLLRVVFNLV